jgi:hypothetical protein
MAEKKISLDLEINKGGSDKTVKSIKTELREAKEEAIALARKFGELSPEATKAAAKLASLKDEMGDLNEKVNGLNPDKFARLSTLTNGVVRGFQAASGAAVLFGNTSEDIEKTIAKLQATMAFADGIQGVMDARKSFVDLGNQIKGGVVNAFTSLSAAKIADAQATGTLTAAQKAYAFAVGTSTGAMKVFRATLASTGIGLLIIAVGVLISKILDYNESINEEAIADKKAKDEKEKLNDQLEKQYDKTEKLNAAREGGIDQLNRELKSLEANGASAEAIFKKKQEILLEEQRILGRANASGIDKAKEYADKTNEIENSKAEYKKKLADDAKIQAKKDTDKAIEDAKVAAEKEKQRLAIDFQSKLDLIKDANEKELVEFDAKREAERKAAELVNADLIKFDSATILLRGDIERRQIEENNKKKLEQEKKFQDDLKKIKDDELALTEELTKQYFDKQRLEITNNHIKNKTSDEAFAKELEDLKIRELNAKLVAQKDYGIDTTATELEIANATNEINTKSNTKSLEEQKKYEESLQSLKTQAITSSFELLNALNQQNENATESAQKKSFERGKALSIAQTVISTYMAAQLAYQSQFIPGVPDPSSPIRGAIAAAAAVASGLAKVITIKKQTFKGTGSTNTSGGGGGGTGGGGIQAPTTGFTQIRTPQNPNQPQQKQPPVKVFVVQKDIQEATIAADRITAKAVVK